VSLSTALCTVKGIGPTHAGGYPPAQVRKGIAVGMVGTGSFPASLTAPLAGEMRPLPAPRPRSWQEDRGRCYGERTPMERLTLDEWRQRVPTLPLDATGGHARVSRRASGGSASACGNRSVAWLARRRID
jgi:hypothetical protein